jgi:hypothetical protein
MRREGKEDQKESLKGNLTCLLPAQSVAPPPPMRLRNNSGDAGAALVENKREDSSLHIGARAPRAATSRLEKEEWWEESGGA